MEGEKKVSRERKSGNEYLFDLALFLIMSARGCIDEPPLYGPLRLINAISKIADFPKYARCLKEDKFLIKMKKEIERNMDLVMYDQEEFKKFLDILVKKFSIELKRRMLIE